MIRFQTEDFPMPVFEQHEVTAWLYRVAAIHEKSIGEINYLMCSDEQMIAHNRTYLNHDYYTDIITFDYSEEDTVSGDIFLAPETIRSNAEDLDVPFQRELLRVFVHGLLHLCGYGDKTPEEETIMHNLEDEALNIYSLPFH